MPSAPGQEVVIPWALQSLYISSPDAIKGHVSSSFPAVDLSYPDLLLLRFKMRVMGVWHVSRSRVDAAAQAVPPHLFPPGPLVLRFSEETHRPVLKPLLGPQPRAL